MNTTTIDDITSDYSGWISECLDMVCGIHELKLVTHILYEKGVAVAKFKEKIK